MTERKKFLILVQLLTILPVLVLNLIGFKKIAALKQDFRTLNSVKSQWMNKNRVQTENLNLISTHKIVNPMYLGAELEAARLSSSPNPIQFVEKDRSENKFFREYKEALASPVIVDFEDIKEILNAVEGDHEGKPHLFISDFTLKKKGSFEDNLYDLNFQLIRRDYEF